jgi:uncharacterized protein (TIGR01319 family)
MLKEAPKVSLALTIDLGSTFTKASLFDLDKAQFLGRAQAPTTVETDVNVGLKNALKNLEGATGLNPYSALVKLASSSAAGGLRMVAVGLVPDLTAEAARRAALGAGAKVERVFAYTLTRQDVDELVTLKPDLVLLAGGTDGGNGAVVVENAVLLAESPVDAPVIFAGNRAKRDEVAGILVQGGKEVFLADNVMPEFGVLDVAPTSAVVRELFLSRITQAKGVKAAESLVDGVIMPTPTAVLKGAELLSRGTKAIPGIGDLMVVDVGGATTDVHSVGIGAPCRPDVIQKGLPEPVVKRTVEGDLGLRYNAPSIMEAAGIETILSGFSTPQPSEEEVVASVMALRENVETIPQTKTQQELDQILAKSAVKVGLGRHCGRLEEVFTLGGMATVQYGKDLTAVSLVIATGGIFANSEWGPPVICDALAGMPQTILAPNKPEILVDADYILGAVGLLSEEVPDVALAILCRRLGLERVKTL